MGAVAILALTLSAAATSSAVGDLASIERVHLAVRAALALAPDARFLRCYGTHGLLTCGPRP